MTFRQSMLALAVYAAMAVPALADQLAQGTFDSKTIALISEFESGSLGSAEAVERCVENFEAESNSATLRDVLAGFLTVPRDTAFKAGCSAVIELLDAGIFSGDDLRSLLYKFEPSKRTDLSGRLLRAIYFTHEAGS